MDGVLFFLSLLGAGQFMFLLCCFGLEEILLLRLLWQALKRCMAGGSCRNSNEVVAARVVGLKIGIEHAMFLFFGTLKPTWALEPARWSPGEMAGAVGEVGYYEIASDCS